MIAQIIYAQKWASHIFSTGELIDEATNCLVIGFQVEKESDRGKIVKLVDSVLKQAKRFDTIKTLVVEPFRHLSSSHIDTEIASRISDEVISAFKGLTEYPIKTSPFGVDKCLTLVTHGCPGAFAFRSY